MTMHREKIKRYQLRLVGLDPIREIVERLNGTGRLTLDDSQAALRTVELRKYAVTTSRVVGALAIRRDVDTPSTKLKFKISGADPDCCLAAKVKKSLNYPTRKSGERKFELENRIFDLVEDDVLGKWASMGSCVVEKNLRRKAFPRYFGNAKKASVTKQPGAWREQFFDNLLMDSEDARFALACNQRHELDSGNFVKCELSFKLHRPWEERWDRDEVERAARLFWFLQEVLGEEGLLAPSAR